MSKNMEEFRLPGCGNIVFIDEATALEVFKKISRGEIASMSAEIIEIRAYDIPARLVRLYLLQVFLNAGLRGPSTQFSNLFIEDLKKLASINVEV